MGKITIKEIAEKAGVSVSAVSIVLNGRKGVADDTRERVLRVIRENDYTPNVNSRRLILQRSFNILVSIDPDSSVFDNYFYTEILKAIVSRGSALGYHVVLTMDSGGYEGSRLAAALSQRNADGVIFLHDIPGGLEHQIRAVDTPFIVVDSHRSEPSYPCIRGDYEVSAYCAVRYLTQRGHRKIAFIGSGTTPDFYIRSITGYNRALAEAGLTVKPSWIQSEAHDELSARECMQKILSGGDIPTAVYCTGDIYAVGVINFLHELGYRVPDDFSIIGIDDISISKYCFPPLTTVRIDKDLMGSKAVEVLDSLINRRGEETVVTIRSDEIAERSTVKDLRGEQPATELNRECRS